MKLKYIKNIYLIDKAIMLFENIIIKWNSMIIYNRLYSLNLAEVNLKVLVSGQSRNILV